MIYSARGRQFGGNCTRVQQGEPGEASWSPEQQGHEKENNSSGSHPAAYYYALLDVLLWGDGAIKSSFVIAIGAPTSAASCWGWPLYPGGGWGWVCTAISITLVIVKARAAYWALSVYSMHPDFEGKQQLLMKPVTTRL